MNKTYVNNLFNKRRVGTIIKYLQDNIWNLSVDNIQYIFDKSFDNKFYLVIIFMLEYFQRKDNVNFTNDYYNNNGGVNGITEYLCELNNHLEILSYYIKKYNSSKIINLNIYYIYPSIDIFKYALNNRNNNINIVIEDLYKSNVGEWCETSEASRVDFETYFRISLKYLLNPRILSMYPLKCGNKPLLIYMVRNNKDIKTLTYLFSSDINEMFPRSSKNNNRKKQMVDKM